MTRGLFLLLSLFSIFETIGYRVHAEPVWSWEDCLHQAARHNPALAGATARLRAAESGVRVARSALRPQLGLGAGADRRGVRDGEMDPVTEFRATVAVDQVLYAGGRLTASVDESLATLAVTETAAWSTAADLTFALRSAYIDLLHAQEELELLHGVTSRRRNNLELVELLYQGGKEHKGSLALSEASLFEAETDVRLADRRIELMRHALQRTVGLEQLHETLKVSGALEVLPPPESVDWDQTLENTPEYARVRAQRRAATAAVQRARSGLRPDLSVSGAAGRYGDHREFERDQWRVGVALSYPLWPGGRHGHEIEQARAILEEIEFASDDVRHQVLQNLADSLTGYRNAIDLVAVRQRFLDASELRAEIARQQYTSGLLSFEDWSRIENDLISNRRLVLSAMQSAMRAEARWLRAAGTTAFQTIETGAPP